MRAAVHLIVVAGLLQGAAAGARAQKVDLPTASALRVMTREAQAEGKGDSSAIVLALDKRVRARFGDFESFPVSIVRRQDLTIYLATPYMAYRRGVIEHLRMREPLAEVPWTDWAVISVSPDRIEAPDVRSVTLTRDGQEIPPLKSLLRPMQFSNGSGGTASLHAGEVHYPMSALAPGATVTITASPASGDPFVLVLEESQLRILK